MNEKQPLSLRSLRIKKLKSLLAIIENSVQSKNYLFRNLYVDKNGREIDILEDGKNSCAAFVSWILLALELIKHPHASVGGTEKDLVQSGWFEISELKTGAVLLWEAKEGKYEKLMHRHVGFYIGDDFAISNDSQGKGFPHKHHYTYNNTRQIEKIYWHPALQQADNF